MIFKSALGVVALAELDALGGSGWLGAGLLGAVLSWLCLVHLPAKDKQIKELTADYLKAITSESERCEAARKEARQDFKEVMNDIIPPFSEAIKGLCSAVEALKKQHG